MDININNMVLNEDIYCISSGWFIIEIDCFAWTWLLGNYVGLTSKICRRILLRTLSKEWLHTTLYIRVLVTLKNGCKRHQFLVAHYSINIWNVIQIFMDERTPHFCQFFGFFTTPKISLGRALIFHILLCIPLKILRQNIMYYLYYE